MLVQAMLVQAAAGEGEEVLGLVRNAGLRCQCRLPG